MIEIDRTPYQEAVDRIAIAAYEDRDRVADREARSAETDWAVEALKRQMLADARSSARRVERQKELSVIGVVEVRPSMKGLPRSRRASVGRSLAAEITLMATGEWTHELLTSSFSLRSGRSVVWRDATEDEIVERREIFEDLFNRSGEGIALCDKALAVVRIYPGSTLGEALNSAGVTVI